MPACTATTPVNELHVTGKLLCACLESFAAQLSMFKRRFAVTSRDVRLPVYDGLGAVVDERSY
jgi:hypothetical protein